MKSVNVQSVVEKLPWHDCSVLSLTYDAQLKSIKMLFEPSDEILEYLNNIPTVLQALKVFFAEVNNVETSGSFKFFERDVDGEILRATFELGVSYTICELTMLLYGKTYRSSQESYGEITFKYKSATLLQE